MTASVTDMAAPRHDGFDPARLRHAFGHVPTGVCVITGLQETGEPYGLTVSSFQTLSLDPALVLYSIRRGASSLAFLASRSSFTINVLRDGQSWIARQFAERRTDRFANVEWFPGRKGNPRLAHAIAHFDCELWSTCDGGDHVIVIGRIHEMSADSEGHPLIYLKGSFLPQPTSSTAFSGGTAP